MIKLPHIIVMFMAGIVYHTPVNAQYFNDSSTFQLHFQQTVVTQYHPGFRAKYTNGVNSLVEQEEAQTSLTTTFFMGFKIARYTQLYFNPEIAGGAGLSKATGIAGFPNGETFRVGNPKPQVYVARLLISQLFPIGKATGYQPSAFNQLAGQQPLRYFQLIAGRLSVSDYFDNNAYSHDPRTQFLNWSLMSNGAYDYAANTRGYTWGITGRLVLLNWQFAAAATMVPRSANGSDMDPNIGKANALQAEAAYTWHTVNPGVLRLLVYQNSADMGNYKQAVNMANGGIPTTITSRQEGRKKRGIGVNMEQALNSHAGVFARASWNDGINETWMFTEIDRSASIGISGDGARWKRPMDRWGIAAVGNGISKPHQNFLAHGGNGFMIGDGQLNYGIETIFEFFYNANIHQEHFFITPDYQFVINPAYNKDRGPVHIFGIRIHTRF